MITVILLLLAVVTFIMRFFVRECVQDYCDILAFLLPTIASLVEIYFSEKNGKATEEKLKKLKEKQLSVHFEGETLVFKEGAEIDE